MANKQTPLWSSRFAFYLSAIGALLVSIFVDWRVSRVIVAAQLEETTPFDRRCVVFLLRYVCPVALTVILLTALM